MPTEVRRTIKEFVQLLARRIFELLRRDLSNLRIGNVPGLLRQVLDCFPGFLVQLVADSHQLVQDWAKVFVEVEPLSLYGSSVFGLLALSTWYVQDG